MFIRKKLRKCYIVTQMLKMHLFYLDNMKYLEKFQLHTLLLRMEVK